MPQKSMKPKSDHTLAHICMVFSVIDDEDEAAEIMNMLDGDDLGVDISVDLDADEKAAATG